MWPIILLLILAPQPASGIGAAQSGCRHQVCGTCGGLRRRAGIGRNLSEVCSPQCQAASGPACFCKCQGKYHGGENSKALQRVLNPQLAQKAKHHARRKTPTATRQIINNFEPENITDYLALFLLGSRVTTSSYDRFSDRNNRAWSKTIALNWLSKSGLGIDQLAKSFNDHYNFGLDQQETAQMIADFITDNPGGAPQYIKRRSQETNIYESYFTQAPSYAEQHSQQAEEEYNPLMEWEGNIFGAKNNLRIFKRR